MKFKILGTFLATSFFLFGSCQAMEDVDLELSRLYNKYLLSPFSYSEDLKVHYQTAQKVLSKAPKDKPLALIVGEKHEARGHSCLKFLLLALAHHHNINDALIEASHEKFEKMRNARKLGLTAPANYEKLLKEAEEKGMVLHPIDIDLAEPTEGDQIEKFKQKMFQAAERDTNFLKEMKSLKKSFISFQGANHLANLYYDEELNEMFHVVVMGTTGVLTKEELEYFKLNCIDETNEQDFFRLWETKIRFSEAQERIYPMPVRYNKSDSNMYKALLESGNHPIGMDPEELRPDDEGSTFSDNHVSSDTQSSS